MSRRASVLAIALLLCACSLVNDPSAHQSGPEPVQATEFCHELAELFCFAQPHCCSTAPEPTEEELTACVESASADCAANGLSSLLVDSRTGYDPMIAGQVLAEGRALVDACSTDILAWYTERSGFQRALTGTVAGGGACTPMDRPIGEFDTAALFSCEGESRACVFVSDSTWSCLDRQPEGGECILYWDCEDGMRCEPRPLQRGLCRPRLEDGMPCSSSVDCQSLFCDITCRTPMQDEVYCQAGLPSDT